ncbi:MAG: DUF2513 domain-containing protein [Lachnospiraceae bacterium]|jgi:hypothetical protein|nr:DUF2513 domain-containing protein [Lachnospiraceae bacterium]
MKLNPNCIRDILIAVETHSDFHHRTEYKQEAPFDSLSAYSHEEIIYHIKQCDESGLIYDVHYYNGGTHTDIRDLSPKGHEFLTNVRNDSVWKKALSKGAGASLTILVELAKEIAFRQFFG